MKQKLPVLKSRDVVRVLLKLGFVSVRQKGSHEFFRHTDGRRTTVPIHGGKDEYPDLLREILRQINITKEEFMKWL